MAVATYGHGYTIGIGWACLIGVDLLVHGLGEDWEGGSWACYGYGDWVDVSEVSAFPFIAWVGRGTGGGVALHIHAWP